MSVSVGSMLESGRLLVRAFQELHACPGPAVSVPRELHLSWRDVSGAPVVFTFPVPQPPVASSSAPPAALATIETRLSSADLDATSIDVLDKFIHEEMTAAAAADGSRQATPIHTKTPRSTSSKKRAIEEMGNAQQETNAGDNEDD